MRRIEMPEGRKKAIRQFVLQILNTSLAVIIALSFEGLVEWRRIRQLVATARQHVRSEIIDNKKDLSGSFYWLALIQKDAARCLATVEAIATARAAGETGEELPEGEITLATLGLVLAATSRDTAEATGALGHMEYAEVKLYAETYGIQEEFMRIRQRMAEEQTRIQGLIRRDFAVVPISELEELRATLVSFQQSVREMKNHGKLLIEFYDRALAGPR
jgi:hypothetical protein